jgi:hypothetical protein
MFYNRLGFCQKGKRGPVKKKETFFGLPPAYNGLGEEDFSIVYRKPRKLWIRGEKLQ